MASNMKVAEEKEMISMCLTKRNLYTGDIITKKMHTVNNSGNTETDFRISLIKRFAHHRECLIIIKLLMLLPFLHL